MENQPIQTSGPSQSATPNPIAPPNLKPKKWPRNPWGVAINVVFTLTLVATPFALLMSVFLFDAPGSEKMFLPNYLLYGILLYPIFVLVWWPISRKFRLVFGVVPLAIWLLTWGWAVIYLIGFSIISPFTIAWQAATFQPQRFNDATHFMCADGSYLVWENDNLHIDINQYMNSFDNSGVDLIADKSWDQPNQDQLSLDGSIAPAYLRETFVPMLEQCKNSDGKNIFDVYGVIIPDETIP
jgi:hypothetical protein